jgi:hypothetical protein
MPTYDLKDCYLVAVAVAAIMIAAFCLLDWAAYLYRYYKRAQRRREWETLMRCQAKVKMMRRLQTERIRK